MAQTVTIGNFTSVLESRIATRLQNLSPKGPRIKEVMTRIGVMIERQAKINVRNKHIIDTGTLLNSIRYRLFQMGSVSGVTVGSYGVPYAAAHEFGFQGPVTVRSHTRVKAFGRPTKPYTVPQYTRFQRVAERPYLRPAVKSVQVEIVELIRGLMRKGGQ